MKFENCKLEANSAVCFSTRIYTIETPWERYKLELRAIVWKRDESEL